MTYQPKYEWTLCPIEIENNSLYIKWMTIVNGKEYYTACRASLPANPIQEAERRIDEMRKLQ